MDPMGYKIATPFLFRNDWFGWQVPDKMDMMKKVTEFKPPQAPFNNVGLGFFFEKKQRPLWHGTFMQNQS